MKTAIHTFFIGLLSISHGIAQDTPLAESILYLKTFTGNNEVLLRWAPSDKYLWKDGLTFGYQLIRKTISRNGRVLEYPEVVTLASTIVPAELKAWEHLVSTDPLAGVVAQAIYGKSFNTSGIRPSSGIGEFILEADELTQRFAFSLHAADLSFQAAVMGGLGFTDRSVVAGEDYVYLLTLNNPDHPGRFESLAYVQTEKASRLPIPEGPVAVAKDSIVLLAWNFEEKLEHYTSYHIERSVDGTEFYRINEQPISPVSSDGKGNTNYLDNPGSFGDFWYRITGLDVFGNESNPSEAFRVRLLPPFVANPEITGYDTGTDGKIMLHCRILQDTNLPAGFMRLTVSDHPTGDFKVLLDSIPYYKATIEVPQSKEVAYYRLLAIDAYQRSRASNTFQVQTVDTLPPSIPQNVIAEQDEAGNIKITWDDVPEPDLMGYDIFFSPAKQFEYSMLNKTPIPHSGFTYSLKKDHSLTSVRFKVRSVDKRYNVSKDSEPVRLVFKRKLQPPVIKDFFYRIGTGLEVSWIAEHHPDLVFQIYRQDTHQAEINQWQLLAALKPQKDDRFVDKDAIPGKTYRYTIVGRTELHGESEPSEPIRIKIPVEPSLVLNDELGLYANRDQRSIHIQWKLDSENLKEVLLYRRKGNDPFTLYKTFSGAIKRYSDDEVAPNNTYSYLVTGLYGNGQKIVLPEGTVIF
ncbi:fibronectin type III domain-containing protein [Robertkochia marina]|uniref:Fibronectin type III domain-containing protein n=1 Tax=Robertkochia marina TaxID=1227945 RepID=A0A4S3M038_9FLAO|nr:fibronectin type III domain-containing protein [Robertkochia marina]THD66263.1 fibronectin type III domain-containing protein [Robertkochia marina]TRZ40901.1 fibronectin type III domain-containing protein [Robertkochia marina]